MSRLPFIAGNWKMHKTAPETREFCSALWRDLPPPESGVEVGVFPPFVNLPAASEALAGSTVALGAQNLHPASHGAFTGEISAAMLLTVGCRYVIIGHSERRALFGEASEFVAEKAKSALAAGLLPVVCIGEQLAEREAGRTESVLREQLAPVLAGLTEPAGLVVAYEPVWAIGTGRTATPDQAQETHAFVRGLLAERWGDAGKDTRILYGGSVKPDNARALLGQADVDGALVGGASLDSESFRQIVKAAL